jgi:zinc and cadmium transporter
MSGIAWLFVYSAGIVVFSLLGGCLPMLWHSSHARLQLYLSLSAGVMLGAAFFHVMPEAMEISGSLFGWWISLAVVGLFSVERFLAPHSHEVADHDHSQVAAPPVAGWMAVLGLTIHTFMNGVGLAGAVAAEANSVILPGVALFLAIILHKPADALAISTVLGRKGAPLGKLWMVQLGFAAMVPVGVVAFQATQGVIANNLQNQVTGFALAFSAGTFLLIALSDLLPEVQFHRHSRVSLFLALVLGVGLMGGIALLEGHKHSDTGTEQAGHEEGHHHHHD